MKKQNNAENADKKEKKYTSLKVSIISFAILSIISIPLWILLARYFDSGKLAKGVSSVSASQDTEIDDTGSIIFENKMLTIINREIQYSNDTNECDDTACITYKDEGDNKYTYSVTASSTSEGGYILYTISYNHIICSSDKMIDQYMNEITLEEIENYGFTLSNSPNLYQLSSGSNKRIYTSIVDGIQTISGIYSDGNEFYIYQNHVTESPNSAFNEPAEQIIKQNSILKDYYSYKTRSI